MMAVSERLSRTGGRQATTRHIPPKLALAVGMPSTPAPNGWRWAPLSSLATLESGHTPSRRFPEYWGGNIPWISIGDAKLNHCARVEDTLEKITELGTQNSSARILPENTVCLSRTASVGYVVVMGRSMATSQDFVNWVCGQELDPDFLKYLFVAEGEDLLRFASGAVHQTIYYPEAKAFHICLPAVFEQRRIVNVLDEAFTWLAIAKTNAEKNLQNARALFESQLHAVFSNSAPSWVKKPLSELCDIKHGYAFEGPDFSSSVTAEHPIVITPGNFTEEATLSFTEKNTKRLSGNVPKDFRFNVGDLVVVMTDLSSKMKILGKPAFVESADILHNQRIGRFMFLSDEVEKRFVYYFLRTEMYLNAIRRSATGTMVKHTAPKRILANLIPFPSSRVEQCRIIAQLDDLAAQTQGLMRFHERKLAALAELKKSLLHQAFNGELGTVRKELGAKAA